MIDIIGLLSNSGYIICNKQIIKLFGTDCAVLLGELCAEYKYFEMTDQLEDDMFYSTQQNIENNTGMSEYCQRQAINKLKNEGIIEVKKKGMPAKNYFKINSDKLFNIFSTSGSNSEQQVVEKLNNCINKNNKTIINNINNKSISNDINTIITAEPCTKQTEYESHLYSEEDFLGSAKKKKKKRGLSLWDKCIDEINNYTDIPALNSVLVEYLKFRMGIKDKPIYNVNQWKSMLRKLDSIVEETKVDYKDIVQNSLDKGWLNFYPINDKSKKDVFSEYNSVNCEKGDEDIVGEF